MQIISTVSSKGGVGKTTLTSALAVAALGDGKRVALVDLDPQGSLEAWNERRGEGAAFDIMEADSASEAVREIDETKYDYLFIDTPPAFLETIKDAIESADIALIPLRPSALDLLASEDAVLMARGYRDGKPNKAKPVAHLCIISDAEPRWKTTEQARDYLKDGDVPVAKTPIVHRVAYLAAVTSGRSGPEIDKSGAAKTEIAALWAEVKAALAKAKKGVAHV